MDKNTVIAAIFFRRPHITYNGENSIECFGSYCRKGYDDIFKRSFSNSIVLLQKEYKFSILIIENISDSNKSFGFSIIRPIS